MGECIRYKNEEIKMGVAESLYIVTYQKFVEAYNNDQLKGVYPGNPRPYEFLEVNQGYRFRFPFPDEDGLDFGDIIEPVSRNLPVIVSKEAYKTIVGKESTLSMSMLTIEQQKPVWRESDGKFCLAVVCGELHSDGRFRIEDEHKVNLLVKEMIRNHIAKSSDQEKRKLYRCIAARILKGYRIDPYAQVQKKFQQCAYNHLEINSDQPPIKQILPRDSIDKKAFQTNSRSRKPKM